MCWHARLPAEQQTRIAEHAYDSPPQFSSNRTCMRESCRQDLYRVRSTPYTGEDCARGVFAVEDIKQGVLVEVAHCIKLSAQEYHSHGRCGQGW